jgi:hypothetical protein
MILLAEGGEAHNLNYSNSLVNSKAWLEAAPVCGPWIVCITCQTCVRCNGATALYSLVKRS